MIQTEHNLPHGFTIYCDLDQVLADYVGAMDSHINEAVRSGASHIESKSLPRKIRAYIKKHGKSYRKITEKQLKEPRTKDIMYIIASQPGFFYSLPRLQNGLWEKLIPFQKQLKFLSAPIGKFAQADKQRWCQDVLQSSSECIVVKRIEKAQYAKDSVLIDDNKDTIDSWRKEGGLAFLWPEQETELYEFLQTIQQPIQ